VFAPLEPPRTYLRRYGWRGDDLYKQLICSALELTAAQLTAAQLR